MSGATRKYQVWLQRATVENACIEIDAVGAGIAKCIALDMARDKKVDFSPVQFATVGEVEIVRVDPIPDHRS
jgi:hypothetical protein